MTLLFLCSQVVEIALHAVGAVLLHLLRNMPVNIERESGGSVADVCLYGLNVVGDRQMKKSSVMSAALLMCLFGQNENGSPEINA